MNAPTWSSANHRSGSFAPRRLHGKFTRDQVAERIAHMRAFRIGLVELDQRIAMRIGFPRHLRSPGSDVGSVDPPGAPDQAAGTATEPSNHPLQLLLRPVHRRRTVKGRPRSGRHSPCGGRNSGPSAGRKRRRTDAA